MKKQFLNPEMEVVWLGKIDTFNTSGGENEELTQSGGLNVEDQEAGEPE